MLYSPQKAEQIVTSHEQMLNEYLMMLALSPDAYPATSRRRRELARLIRKIERIRLKPNNRPGSAEWYLRLLYLEPFEGIANIGSLARAVAEDCDLSVAITPSLVSNLGVRFEQFHRNLAAAFAAGEEAIAERLLAEWVG